MKKKARDLQSVTLLVLRLAVRRTDRSSSYGLFSLLPARCVTPDRLCGTRTLGTSVSNACRAVLSATALILTNISTNVAPEHCAKL